MAPPADRCEPGSRRNDRCASDWSFCRHTPAREPRCGRSWVETAHARQVLSPVLEYVHERMPNLARRIQRTRMIPIGPNSPVAVERAVDALRDANRQSLDAATQTGVSIRFDEQMDVIVLNAEVEHPESICGRSSESGVDGAEDVLPPKRREIAACAERCVCRAATVVHCAAAVGNAPPAGRRLASGAITPPAPGRRRGKLQLARCALHLEWAHITTSLLSCQVQTARIVWMSFSPTSLRWDRERLWSGWMEVCGARCQRGSSAARRSRSRNL